MTRHPGQQPGIVPQIAADRVEDGEPDAACLDLDQDFARAGFGVQSWIIDEEDVMRCLIGWGVVGVISDRPDVAVRVVRSGAG